MLCLAERYREVPSISTTSGFGQTGFLSPLLIIPHLNCDLSYLCTPPFAKLSNAPSRVKSAWVCTVLLVAAILVPEWLAPPPSARSFAFH